MGRGKCSSATGEEVFHGELLIRTEIIIRGTPNFQIQSKMHVITQTAPIPMFSRQIRSLHVFDGAFPGHVFARRPQLNCIGFYTDASWKPPGEFNSKDHNYLDKSAMGSMCINKSNMSTSTQKINYKIKPTNCEQGWLNQTPNHKWHRIN